MTQPFEPLNIEDFPDSFRKEYGPTCHQLIVRIATMATRGETDSILLLARLLEKALNAGMLIIEESKKQEGKAWSSGWVTEGRA